MGVGLEHLNDAETLLMAAKGLILISYACLPDNVGNGIKYVQFCLLPSALPILPNLQKMAA